MKKIYKAPLTKVVKIKSEKMLTGSRLVPKGEEYNGGILLNKDDYDEEEDAFDDLW